MKAAYFEQVGPPEVLKIGEVEMPRPKAGEVLVRVRATTVNPIDTYIRAGKIPVQLPTKFIPGCDVAGVVEEMGPGAKSFRTGDRVWGSNQGLMGRQGATAEFVCADEKWFYPIPDGVNDNDAAALSLVSLTAWLGLIQKGEMKAGETVFVNGGSGGVGSAVVQMAKATGARVIATAGSDEKVKLCKDLGADEAFNYKTENIGERIRKSAPRGIDVWYDTTRDPDLMTAVPLLAPQGRIILMAGREATPSFPLGSFYTRDCKILGFAMFNAAPEDQRRAAEEINGWIAEGKLRALIGRVMPMEQIAAAHRLQEENTLGQAGTLSGKIVIAV